MSVNNTYFDRILKSALTVFNKKNSDAVDYFPPDWTVNEMNSFLDMLLDYCIHPNREMWEQAAIIRDVKKEINETW